jgi:hypothetical protein
MLFHPLQGPMCFSCELYALRLCRDEEEWLSDGFAKKEKRDHEPMETLSAAVPLLGCGSVALPMQH